MKKYFEQPILIDVEKMAGDLVKYVKSCRDDEWELIDITSEKMTTSEGIVIGQKFKSTAHKILLIFDIMDEGEKVGETTEHKKTVYTKKEAELVINRVKQLLNI